MGEIIDIWNELSKPRKVIYGISGTIIVSFLSYQLYKEFQVQANPELRKKAPSKWDQ